MLAIDINQGDAVIILAGIPHKISGWSDSQDCLSFPDASEINAFKKGADGKMVLTRTGERGGAVVIKVLPNSPFVDRMAAEIGLIDQGVQVPIAMTFINTTVGDSVSCLNGGLISAPRGVTYGKGDVGEMVYTFEFEKITFLPVGSKRGTFLESVTGDILG